MIHSLVQENSLTATRYQLQYQHVNGRRNKQHPYVDRNDLCVLFLHLPSSPLFIRFLRFIPFLCPLSLSLSFYCVTSYLFFLGARECKGFAYVYLLAGELA